MKRGIYSPGSLLFIYRKIWDFPSSLGIFLENSKFIGIPIPILYKIFSNFCIILAFSYGCPALRSLCWLEPVGINST